MAQKTNKFNKGYSNKSKSKDGSRTSDRSGQHSTSTSTNRSGFGDLVLNAAQLNFSTTLGVTENWVWDTRYPIKQTLPGIMRIGLTPTIGSEYVRGEVGNMRRADPVNQAAQGVMTFIRKANSGSVNYGSADVMMYLYTFDNMYMMYCNLIRAYGLLRTYYYNNRYMPMDVLKFVLNTTNEEHIKQCMENLPRFKSIVDMFAAEVSQFSVPTTMPLFSAHMEPFTNIYVDRNGTKAQAYVLGLDYYYVFEQFSDSNGGQLIKTAFEWDEDNNDFLTQLGDKLEAMLNPIREDEFTWIISGDIAKAYGDGNLWKFGLLNPDYETPVVFDETMLSRIHNMTAISAEGIGNITQDVTTAYLYQDIHPEYMDPQQPDYLLTPVIDVKWDNPTPADVANATFYTSIASSDNDEARVTTGYFAVTSAMAKTKDYPDATPIDLYRRVPIGDVPTAITTFRVLLERLAMVDKFDWAPIRYVLIGEGVNSRDFTFWGELHNYKAIDYDFLSNLNRARWLEAYGLPSLATHG